MSKRALTGMKDDVVLAFLRSRFDEDKLASFTCAQIATGVTGGDRMFSLLNHEETYNCLLRLIEDGEVERFNVNSRVVLWRSLRGHSILVAEPNRTLR